MNSSPPVATWSHEVGISVVYQRSSYDFDFFDLCTLALRRNPLRAQLIVSKVLAKHLPVPAHRVIASARSLADAIKVDLINRRDVAALPSGAAASDSSITVIGMAETATGLAALVAEEFPGADLLTTTRDVSDRPDFLLTFTEPHSHAATHHILRGAGRLLQFPRTVIVIDDEISHGTTLANLIGPLRNRYPDNTYLAASLIDVQVCDQESDVGSASTHPKRAIPIVSLAEVSLDVSQRARTWVTDHGDAFAFPRNSCELHGQWTSLDVPSSPLLDARHGVESWTPDLATPLLRAARQARDQHDWKRILVIGAEEFMYPSIAIAQALNADVQSTTRSPIALLDRPDYPFSGGFTFPSLYDPRVPAYLYESATAQNQGQYEDVVVVLPASVSEMYDPTGLMQAANQLGTRTWLLRVSTEPQVGAR